MAHKLKGGKGRKPRRKPAGSRKGSPVVEGTLRVSRPGSATVSTQEGVFQVARGGIREGMSGDIVRCSLVRRGQGEPQAVVQSVVSRATTTFLGTFGLLEPLGVVVPLDERIRRDFFVLPGDESVARLGVSEGDVVAARILTYPTRKDAGVCTLDRRVGSGTELDLNVEGVIASHGLATVFPEDALAEAEGLSLDVEQALAHDPLRRDLRGECCLTIDPTDARDFDDAVFGRRLPEGGFEVCVHIADVTHYVRWGSHLDVEARTRATSVYLVDRVLPMLPERLSNDLCSLRPNEDRLCMSVALRLDASGEVKEAEAFPSVIRSQARLDYDTADALLAGMIDVLPQAGVHSSEVAEAIRVLDEVSRLRQTVRAERGAVDFDSVEAHVLLDEDGRACGVTVRRRTPATQLVEEAMLLANEAVAGMLASRDVPAAYRVHEPPAQDNLRELLPVLHELGLAKGDVGQRLAAGDPHAMRDVLDQARGTSAESLVSALLVRAQMRAVYLPQNLGHFALGAKAYCHFTSPIRRYPDVIVHRALRALLEGKLGSREQQEIVRALPQLCRTSSEQERTADAASRDSQKVKLAELMAGHVGESFSGVVTGVTRAGLFVTLDDTLAEGLLPMRSLGEGWLAHDEARMTLTDSKSGKVWRLGMRVAVRVTGANPARGQIDLELA